MFQGITGALAAIITFSIAVGAATQGGSIKGKVVADIPDQQRALPGVVVNLRGDRLGERTLQTVTDYEGAYSFAGLVAGEYLLSIEFQGFKKYEQKISIQIDATVEHDALLQPLPLSETVTVTDDRTEASRTESTTPSVITQSALREAPLIDQKFQDALPLLPGVVRGPDGNLNIKGTRPSQSGILVSSLNVTDPWTGTPAIELPLEAVDTVQVHSNPYSSEYGKFTGAVTTIETRSGSNDLRYLFTGVLPRPRWRDGKMYGIGAATPRIAVGGPIKKDKLFFFQSLEYRFVRTNVPSLEALEEHQRDIQRESFDSFSRLDYVINSNNRLTASFSIFPQKQDFFNLNTFNPSDTTANFHQRGWFLAFNEQATFKSGGLLQSSFSIKQFDGDIFGNSGAAYQITPERNFGGWFDRQHRESRRYELLEIFNLAPFNWRGSHALKVGVNYSHTTFSGSDRSAPVSIIRADGTTYQQINFSGPGELSRHQNEISAFVQNKWIVNSRVVFDLGLRYDRDQIGAENNFAPRLGLVLVPHTNGRTVVRGGVGLFYDKIPLNVGSFEQYQDFGVTTFDNDGTTIVDGPRLFLNTAPSDLKNPYSLAWNVQVDHEVTPRLLLRLGYEERSTRRDFVLEPIAEVTGALISTPRNSASLSGSAVIALHHTFNAEPQRIAELRREECFYLGHNLETPALNTGRLLLLNSGRSRYRELQAVARFRLQEGRNIFLSYVRSQARGNLNDFNHYFGNLQQAVIRPDEYAKQPFDAPNRMLFWGEFALPFDVVATPVVDWRTGFPFSLVNEQQDFVGPRNEGGRFPSLFSLDVLVMKGLTIPFRGKKYRGRAGMTIFNITNHWNPRDVQNNLDSRQFGTFFNSPGLSVRLKFEFVKY